MELAPRFRKDREFSRPSEEGKVPLMPLEDIDILVTALETLQPTSVHVQAETPQLQVISGPPLKAALMSHITLVEDELGGLVGARVGELGPKVGDDVGAVVGALGNCVGDDDGARVGKNVSDKVGKLGNSVGYNVGAFVGEAEGPHTTEVPKFVVDKPDRHGA